ncbi:hypothetical protein AAG906_029705 [Vitis piasezkii]
MASLGSLLCTRGSPTVPAPPNSHETTPPPQHTPRCICPRLYILLLLSLRLSALIADTEYYSGFSHSTDGHYSGTPGSDHCYSGPAYHDPSSDSARFEYAHLLGMIGPHHPSL